MSKHSVKDVNHGQDFRKISLRVSPQPLSNDFFVWIASYNDLPTLLKRFLNPFCPNRDFHHQNYRIEVVFSQIWRNGDDFDRFRCPRNHLDSFFVSESLHKMSNQHFWSVSSIRFAQFTTHSPKTLEYKLYSDILWPVKWFRPFMMPPQLVATNFTIQIASYSVLLVPLERLFNPFRIELNLEPHRVRISGLQTFRTTQIIV